MFGRRLGLLAVAMLVVSACDDSTSEPEPGTVTYTVQVSNEQFKVRVTDSEVIAKLDARMAAGSEGVIIGSLARGHGGYNQPWGWHLEAETVDAVDMSIELCDGRPSLVQDDLDYWIDTVRSYCPWGAKVIAKSE